MLRLMPNSACLVLIAILAGCTGVPVAVVPTDGAQPVAEAEPVPVPPPPPAMPAPAARVVVLLVGGEPVAMVPRSTMDELGAQAVAYLASCRARDRHVGGELEWEAARGAPLCVTLQFLPPAEIATRTGASVRVAELLVPLGITRFEGAVLARDGAPPYAELLAGDPALFQRLRQEAVGAMGQMAMGP
jgi:hypothetical protein